MPKNFWKLLDKNKGKNPAAHSSYWLGNMRNMGYTSALDESDDKSSAPDIFQLLEIQNGLSNFVRILTQRSDINVSFPSKGSVNQPNGKTIMVSPDLEGGKFDIAVGLLLHEASHVLYTDFDVLSRTTEDFKKETNANNDSVYFYRQIFHILEDFYIDSITYKNAPGYRGYYQALYNEYFNSNDIIKAFSSDEYSSIDWESYMFHLCNIRNPKRNLDALPKLREIFELINLPSIARLTHTSDRLQVARLIYDIINEQVRAPRNQPNENEDEGGSGEGSSTASDKKELPATVKTRLRKLHQKQQDFYRGVVKKKQISTRDYNDIEQLSKMESEVRYVEYENGYFSLPDKLRVLVVKNIGQEAFDEGSSIKKFGIYPGRHRISEELINEAIANGKQLARKIQLRNEERVIKTTRLDSGKIDRRLIHELGVENTKIFNKLNITTHKPVHIHISIDQSGSMSGSRFDNSILLAATFAAASKFIKNLHVCVSLRGNHGQTPYLVYIFDSKKNGINDIKQIFPHCDTQGETPEALAFAAIQDEIKKDALNTECYFINICDGEPNFSYRHKNKSNAKIDTRYISPITTYSGYSARLHCNHQMRLMEKNNVKFLAYFLDNVYSYGLQLENMKECYGDRVVVIKNVNDINLIARSLNQKLLENVYC